MPWHPFFTWDVQILGPWPSLMCTSYTWYGRRFLVVTCLVGSVGKNVDAFFDLHVFLFYFFESFWLTCICIIYLSFYMMSRFNPPLCLPFPVKKFFFEHNIKLSKSPHKYRHILQVASPRNWSKVSIYSVSICRKSKQ